MKISLFYKPSTLKVYSFLICVFFFASTPTMVSAGFFSNISNLTSAVFGGNQVQAEGTYLSNDNSQTVQLLAYEPPINPDLRNGETQTEPIIGQEGSFVESYGGLFISDNNFEKSSISDQIIIYTVKEGDTLSEIAESFGLSMNTIIWENNISGQKISIGQKLNILPMTGVKHTVKSGDTISKIATKYEAEVDDIMIFNDIKDGNVLKQGDIIFVPNGIIKTVISKPSSSGSSKNSVSTSNTKVQSGYYLRPTTGRVTSPYGSRKRGFHPGVDFGNSRGTPVIAAASGVVSKVVNGCYEGKASCGGGYGNYIDIQHSNGTMTRYGHLSKVNVSIGQNVSQGQNIGAIGNTGSSTGPHLHFEIRNSNGSAMKPPF